MSNLNYHTFTTNATLDNGLEVELDFMLFPNPNSTYSRDILLEMYETFMNFVRKLT